MKFSTIHHLRLCALVPLCLSAFLSFSQTNVYLDVTGMELNRRMNVIPNFENLISDGAAEIHFPNAVITTNFSTTTFENIDLSINVGTNSAITIIHVLNNTTTARDIFFITPGYAGTYGNADGIGSATVDAGGRAFLAVVTDSNGMIYGRVSAGDFTLTLVAYIRRHQPVMEFAE